jgi:hypothetical protein
LGEDLPVNLFLSVLIVVGVTAAAIGLLLAIRARFAPEGGFFTDGDRAAGVFGVLATGFAVLLGFVVYLAFTSYDTARSGARGEATAVVQQLEIAQLLPQPASAKLSGLLVCYGRAVIGVEWPQLQSGRSPNFNPWGLPLLDAFKAVRPVTPAQQNGAYPKWLDLTSDREEARLDRIQAGSHVIPTPLWMLLFVTAVLVFVFAFFFADRAEGKLPQAVMIGTLAVMLVSSLLVVRFLDQPYASGVGGLKPVDMTRRLAQVDQAIRTLGVQVPIPCDAAGRPL